MNIASTCMIRHQNEEVGYHIEDGG